MATKKRINFLYGLIGVLLILITGSFLLNWTNVFRPAIQKNLHITAGNTLAPYKIAVYYFPGKKNAASALSYYFQQKKYLVELLPAIGVAALEYKRYSPSHIFFKAEELAQAMSVKSEIEAIVGYPVSAYRFSDVPDNVSMIVVFTNDS